MFLMGNKQYVILRPYKAFNWLLVEIIDKIRARYGVSFIVLVPRVIVRNAHSMIRLLKMI